MNALEAQAAISVRNLCKEYRTYQRPGHIVSEIILRRPRHVTVGALKNVSFDLPRGQILGIIGRNGAGKSTLLKILTGVLQPTSGKIQVRGRISHLLELGGGFNPNYTGRDNIYFGGACMSMSRSEIDRKFNEIIEFSELGPDIDRPFRTYSSGMQARLAFAVAIAVDPDILLIDEWLAVGDARFALKCYEKIREFRDRGVTILFVTHNYPTLTEFCDRGLVLDRGQVLFDGDPLGAVMNYQRVLFGDKPKQPLATTSAEDAQGAQVKSGVSNPYDEALATFVRNTSLDFSKRMGSKEARFSRVAIVNSRGEPCHAIVSGDDFKIYLEIEVKCRIHSPAVGLFIKDRQGRIIISTDTNLFPTYPLAGDHLAGSQIVVVFNLKNSLAGGIYFMGAALAGDDDRRIDVIHDLVMFQVLPTPLNHTDVCINVFPEVSAASFETSVSATSTG